MNYYGIHMSLWFFMEKIWIEILSKSEAVGFFKVGYTVLPLSIPVALNTLTEVRGI